MTLTEPAVSSASHSTTSTVLVPAPLLRGDAVQPLGGVGGKYHCPGAVGYQSADGCPPGVAAAAED